MGYSVGGINQIGRRDANSNFVVIRSVIHKKIADGSACAANADCRRVGDAGVNQMLFVLNELYDPGEPERLILTDSMSFGLLVLENRGEREKN